MGLSEENQNKGEELYRHMMNIKFINEMAELKAAVIKNTGQLRELNHILRVKKIE